MRRVSMAAFVNGVNMYCTCMHTRIQEQYLQRKALMYPQLESNLVQCTCILGSKVPIHVREAIVRQVALCFV